MTPQRAGKQALQVWLDFGVPLLLLLVVTVVCRVSDLDLAVQRSFYEAGSGWVYEDFWLWQLLYEAGMVPGLLLGLGGLVCLLLSLRRADLRRYRRPALFLFLLLAIGPGLIVNAVFKENWGRPRPNHVVEFGGEMQYLPVWVKGDNDKGNSFASGHASIGFYMIAPFFLLRRRNRVKARLALAGGLAYGALMGIGRMVQGGHFFSDVAWGGGFVVLTGMVLYYLLRPDEF